MIDKKRRAQLEARANILKAMAHPTRLFILEELAHGEKNVGELTGMIGADTSTVSKHLSLLKTEGIIADEKRGQSVYYSLLCPCVLNFYQCVEGVIKTKISAQSALVE
ncbi:ArsR/SmtB family transcription factor [candidate division KSB1 bacterium]